MGCAAYPPSQPKLDWKAFNSFFHEHEKDQIGGSLLLYRAKNQMKKSEALGWRLNMIFGSVCGIFTPAMCIHAWDEDLYSWDDMGMKWRNYDVLMI